MAYELPPLAYDYAALEPFIDAETMKLHHDKHHQTYITNVNAALASHPDLAAKSVDDLIRGLAEVPEDIRGVVRNNGGGHSNHTAFWTLMGPVGSAGVGGAPSGPIADQITADFGDFEAFKKIFNETTAKQFGSGWGWLVFTGGKLVELGQLGGSQQAVWRCQRLNAREQGKGIREQKATAQCPILPQSHRGRVGDHDPLPATRQLLLKNPHSNYPSPARV